MQANGLDLTHIEQLVAHWRERAEQIRAEPLPTPARADVYDICAAQLSDALAAMRAEHSETTESGSLSLFAEQAETSADAASQEPEVPVAGEEATKVR
ncbi:MAG: hypothetical protein M3497_01990 [Gemmatimonadota bacterium]|nr:hypothetical protein [Gemmatimonadota bacterium]